jgi:DNA-binding transcriptional LysR family regulator
LLDSLLSGGAVDGVRKPSALQVHYKVERSSTAVGLVAEGVAAAVVPKLASQSGAYPRLRVIPLQDLIIFRTLALVVGKGARLSPAAQVLHDLIVSSSMESRNLPDRSLPSAGTRH